MAAIALKFTPVFEKRKDEHGAKRKSLVALVAEETSSVDLTTSMSAIQEILSDIKESNVDSYINYMKSRLDEIMSGLKTFVQKYEECDNSEKIHVVQELIEQSNVNKKSASFNSDNVAILEIDLNGSVVFGSHIMYWNCGSIIPKTIYVKIEVLNDEFNCCNSHVHGSYYKDNPLKIRVDKPNYNKDRYYSKLNYYTFVLDEKSNVDSEDDSNIKYKWHRK